MNRRRFLESTALAGGGLLLFGSFPGIVRAVALNAWVRIDPDDTVTIVLSQAEMGQGVHTTLPAILADELGADWTKIRVENSPAGPAYRNPKYDLQFTGNAESIRSFFPVMRAMGASARELLVKAAANRFRVPARGLTVSNGEVRHEPSGQTATFGALAADASQLTPPANPGLKDPSEWRLLGRELPRLDIPEKVRGRAEFGIDVEIDGMVHAAIGLCPVFGGEVRSFDKAAIASMPGFIDVVPIPNGVAVVAESYWQANRALAALPIEYDEGEHRTLSSETLNERYRAVMNGDSWTAVVDEGNARARFDETEGPTVRGEYISSWQSHAPMEPMNCTAKVSDAGCELWAPTQGQQMAQVKVGAALDLDPSSIQVHRTFLGGGFGRRLIADYAMYAALAAKAVRRPVKAIWSRSEDLQHDHYRPRTLHRLEARLGADGLPVAIQQRLVSPTILSAVMVNGFQFRHPETEDPSCTEGLKELPYDLGGVHLDFHTLEVPVPTMVWRTTGFGPNVFALESFIDELAAAAEIDPYEYRRRLILRGEGNDRALAVLDRAAEAARWSSSAPAGRHRGIALAYAFETYIAQVVELSISEDKVVDLHKVISAVDCGRVLDPGIARSSIEGGIVWGLNQCFISEISFDRGRVVQSNFDDYKLFALPETPETETYFVESGASLGGMGEVGPIPVTPAVINAIYAATGERYRELPLSKHGIYTRYAKQFVGGSR
ncbi:MAG: molybdopterin cofactor-binding domain-containing protein [Myxococcota bacterium]